MPKVRTVNIKSPWKSIKRRKRAEYNREWDKIRSDVVDITNDKTKENIKIEFDEKIKARYENPRDVPLDQAVLYMISEHDGSITIHFRDDASEEEINAISALVESDMNVK